MKFKDPGLDDWLGYQTDLDSAHVIIFFSSPLPSLVAQVVKNLPAMRESWVPSLGWEDPLEKGKATHSSILAYKKVKYTC